MIDCKRRKYFNSLFRNLQFLNITHISNKTATQCLHGLKAWRVMQKRKNCCENK